jgi:hypothetical protein
MILLKQSQNQARIAEHPSSKMKKQSTQDQKTSFSP